ncbi:sodium:solute symporter [Sphingomonas lacunae]|nr:sodium:solute symporter [Sphingomonas lacunae]
MERMTLAFTALDWTIVGGYVGALALAGWLSSRRAMTSTGDYFLANHHVPVWLVTVSVLSTTQSAATFLGAPDYAFRGDYTYLASNIGAVIAAFVVAHWLIPRFYAMQVTTVYELLEQRFDAKARRAAAAMYLVGRVLASGARLYLAAIAVSMMIFLDVTAEHIFIAALVLMLFGLAFTLFGGLNAVIWSDLVQVVLYVGAALIVLWLLWNRIPATGAEIADALRHAPDGTDKLRLFDWSTDLTKPFSMLAIMTGVVLLNIGNAGLDQDTTQRFLACEDAKAGKRALFASALATIPVVLIFLMIGSLLHIFYERPDLMVGTATGATMSSSFSGEKITVFMSFILSEIPPGIRGLVTVGVIAAAAINSGLISMSAVVISDFYRPWLKLKGAEPDEGHFVAAGRLMVVILAIALLGMAVLCFWWQRYTDMPLLEFVLSVMAFAYSGLLGVYGVALFSRRGSSGSVILALAAGFGVTLIQQAYIVDSLGLPAGWKSLAFPWQLLIGTSAAALVCMLGRPSQRETGSTLA